MEETICVCLVESPVASVCHFLSSVRLSRRLPGSLGLFWARQAHHLHILQGWREACSPPNKPGGLAATPQSAEPLQGLAFTQEDTRAKPVLPASV